MRKSNLVVLSLLITLVLAISSFGQGANGCTDGRINGIYYTSCWADTGDDTSRIQDAVNLAGGINSLTKGGKLVFNEGDYQISSFINLISYVNLEGVSVNSSASYPGSRLHLTGTNTSVFKIGSNVVEVTIRDLALSASTKNETRGILAEGVNLGNTGASTKFEFSNLRFSGFKKAIQVRATDGNGGWQFDNVKLTQSTFENNEIAIEIDANDSGWHMSSSNFIVPQGSYGIKILHGGYISMNLLIGNGAKDNNQNPLAKTFIYIERHSVVSIQNCVSEGFTDFGLHIDSKEKTSPITLINNGFGAQVSIKDSSVVSSGNVYAQDGGISQPEISGNSDVVSIGDRFCYADQPEKCPASGFKVIGNSVSLQSMTNSGDSYLDFGKPMLKIESPLADKVLMELGNTGFGYKIRRGTNGWLYFEGSQSSPYRGFNFNGPVALGQSTFVNLPTGTPNSGSMIYCLDCTKNTKPCQSGGTGALAVLVAGQWDCQ